MNGRLAGRTVLITRPEPEGEESAAQVAALGGRALLAPMLVIGPPSDPAALAGALARIGSFDAVVVTSANGVRALVGVEARRVFAVGPKTRAALRAAGLAEEVEMPDRYDATALAELMLRQGVERVLFLRAEEGREELPRLLRQAGVAVEVVSAYRAWPTERLPEAVAAALRAGQVDAVTFMSGRSAQAFMAVLPARAWLEGVTVAALSEVTAAAVRETGLTVQVVARQATSEALLAALADYWHGSS